jgi:hypothetical protein
MVINHIMPTGDLWRAQSTILTVVSLFSPWQLKEFKPVFLINSVKKVCYRSEFCTDFQRLSTEKYEINEHCFKSYYQQLFGKRIQRFDAANNQARQSQFPLLYTLKIYFQK